MVKQKKQVRVRTGKGQSLFEMPTNYTIIDLETTGFDSQIDEIIELGALKVCNEKVVEEFQTLIRPKTVINGYITKLTGITNEMVINAPAIQHELKKFTGFIGNDIVVAHNAHFDINFIYDKSKQFFNQPFTNDFVDTLRLSRRLLPNLDNHKLSTLSDFFNVSTANAHRALADCTTVYQICKNLKMLSIDPHSESMDYSKKQGFRPGAITTNKTQFDIEHALYNKTVVFTGKLETFTRKEAAQIVVDFGAILGNSVTTQTNYLVLGNFEYLSSVTNNKSSKLEKAEKLVLEGHDLVIISENVFLDLINNE